MDTDNLSTMAYETLLMAEKITHMFTIDLGAMSNRFKDEDSYLQCMLKFVRHTKRFPGEYIEEWDLEDEISSQSLRNDMILLEKHILKTLSIPVIERGKSYG